MPLGIYSALVGSCRVPPEVMLGHLGGLGGLPGPSLKPWRALESAREGLGRQWSLRRGAVQTEKRDESGGTLRRIREALPGSTRHSTTHQCARGHAGGFWVNVGVIANLSTLYSYRGLSTGRDHQGCAQPPANQNSGKDHACQLGGGASHELPAGHFVNRGIRVNRGFRVDSDSGAFDPCDGTNTGAYASRHQDPPDA